MSTDESPPFKKPRIKSAPKIRELFWCDFQEDALNPEFWKRRPVIIISKTSKVKGSVTVVPCSTQAQTSRWAFPLQTTIDGKAAWAICNYPTTVSTSRLVAHQNHIRRLKSDEFKSMLAVVLDYLPSIEKS